MDGQEDFYDIPSYKRTPAETRARLVELALPFVGGDKKVVLADLLDHKFSPNGGNAVTDELKYTGTLAPGLFVTRTSLTVGSQILPSELDPCFPNRPLGRSRRRRNFQ